MNNEITLLFDENDDDFVWSKSIFKVYKVRLINNNIEIGYMKIVLVPLDKKIFSTVASYALQWNHTGLNEHQQKEYYKKDKKFFHKKALVAYSKVETSFQGQGFGSLMYQFANDNIKKMGYTLGSDTTRSFPANQLWNKMLSKNLAYFENNRYYLK